MNSWWPLAEGNVPHIFKMAFVLVLWNEYFRYFGRVLSFEGVFVAKHILEYF